MSCFVVLSGCSGGGKSTLLAELGSRGYAVVEEPGRRIVKDELATGGTALPWEDAVAFARRAVRVALADISNVGSSTPWVFFDRGLVDATSSATPSYPRTCEFSGTTIRCSWRPLGRRSTCGRLNAVMGSRMRSLSTGGSTRPTHRRVTR